MRNSLKLNHLRMSKNILRGKVPVEISWVSASEVSQYPSLLWEGGRGEGWTKALYGSPLWCSDWRKSKSTWGRGCLDEGPHPRSHPNIGKLPCHSRCHASRYPNCVKTRVPDIYCVSSTQEVGRWSHTLSILPGKRSPGGARPTGSLPSASHFPARSRSFGHWPFLCEKAKGNIKTYVNVSLKKLLLQRLEQGS